MDFFKNSLAKLLLRVDNNDGLHLRDERGGNMIRSRSGFSRMRTNSRWMCYDVLCTDLLTVREVANNYTWVF